jgi:BirA family biotin operon repressor/biotin-[acetyl-CoA-carboxylase] ligase
MWPPGYGRLAFDELESTNSEARRLAESGGQAPVWITAARQTAGRGRRGRAWTSGAGDLAATLLLRPLVQPPVTGQLSFVAALAVADTAAHFAVSTTITVKWPNDVLAEGKKLAGILLEGGRDKTGSWLVIGVGMNLAHCPQGTEFPATSLVQLGLAPPSADQALAVLATSFAHWYDAWMKNGFEIVRAGWLARASGLGAPIRARLASQEIRTGVFEGIDEGGALLLKEGACVRAIAAGEVFF